MRELPVSTGLRRLLELFAAGDRPPTPSTPIPASAVVLLRDTPEGLQVFVTRQSDARGVVDRNRWSFPFAELVPSDVRRLPMTGWNAATCARMLRMSNSTRALSHFAAAGRVALENLGIVLAADLDGRVVNDRELPLLGGTRRLLADKRMRLPQVLEDRDLHFRADLLRPWLRWVNTSWQLRRYDMVYFVAAEPAGQSIEFQSPNDSWGGWMTPAQVLEAVGEDNPDGIAASTRLVCESLAALPSVGSAMTRVRNMEPIEPDIVAHDDAWWLTIDLRSDPTARGRVRDSSLLANEPHASEGRSLMEDAEPNDDEADASARRPAARQSD